MNARAPTGNTAFNLLLSLEEAVVLTGGAVPKYTDAREQWSGVRCLVAGINFIVPVHQVAEILEPRALAAIPGCATWVKGLMNVRGRLLPVFDISEFFNGGRTRNGSFQIILVEQGTIFCGIAVDKVFGMQKFFQEDFREGNSAAVTALDGIGEYTGLFTAKGSDDWYQLDMCGLAARMSHTNPVATVANASKVDGPRQRPAALANLAATAETHVTSEGKI